MSKKIEPEVLGTKIEFESKYMTIQSESLLFTLVKDNATEQLAKKYYTLKSPDFVVGIVTDADKILVVNQYRRPVQGMNLEFVAGMVDEGHSPLKAIKKELLEEAGIKVNEIYLLGKCRPLAGRNLNQCYIYHCDNFEQVKPNLEPYERFTGLKASWMSLKKFHKLVRTNKMQDGVTLMSWALFLEKFLGNY